MRLAANAIGQLGGSVLLAIAELGQFVAFAGTAAWWLVRFNLTGLMIM